jgi:hypothetical protein
MDQNNIILVLLLIAVLVAFYAIYLGMENSKRIKKISIELNDSLKLIDETIKIRKEIDVIPPINMHPITREDLDEYPSLEEVNSNTLNPQNLKVHNEIPLEENLKSQIDNLESMSEEELLNLERRLENENSDFPLDNILRTVDNEVMELQNINLEEINAEDSDGADDANGTEDSDGADDAEGTDGADDANVAEDAEDAEVAEVADVAESAEDAEVAVGTEGAEDAEVADGAEDAEVADGADDDEVAEDAQVAKSTEGAEEKYPNLSNLNDDILNNYNCDELREICKKEDLRTRGKKVELVERILKKKNALT